MVHGVNAYLYASEGDEDGANSYLDTIKQIVEYPDEKKKLEIWQNKVDEQLYPEKQVNSNDFDMSQIRHNLELLFKNSNTKSD